jgi:Tol biopolymer transport system component
VLERCLQKDPRQRLRDIGDVRLALEGAFETPAPQTTGKAPPSASRERLAWMALGIAVLGMAALAVPALRHLRESTPQLAPESRTEIVTASGTEPTSFALSPDGRLLVFVASRDGVSQLWLRALESTTAQPLTGTEGASYPFWSPDSRSVAFFADATVKRLDLNGGRPQTLTRAAPRGGAWNASGDILFAATSVGPLFRISAAGGQVAPMTTLDRQASHRFPVFLPDGRRFLYYAQGSQETSGIFLASLDSTDVVRLTQASSAAVYLPAGWLLWVRGGALVGQRLDLERRALTGDLVTLSDLATFDATTAAGAVSASATGLVAFRASGAIRRQLTWFSREGTKLGAAGEADDNGLNGPSVSPDGRRVAVARTVDNNTDIWVVDAVRSTRLMFDPNLDRYPIWSPDGKWIAFDSSRRGTRDLYRMAADGADGAELLLETPGSKTLTSWSRDGRFLFFHSLDGPAGRDLWMLPMDGDRTPRLFLKTPFEERQGQLSPDGRWLAYMSNESGRDEIYVRPFAGATSTAPSAPPGGRWQVSTAGGIYPRWQPEGRELYFLEPAGYMMAAPVVAADTSLTPGSPQRLFKTDIWGGGVDIQVGAQYDVSRDGRFLVNSVVGEAATPITLIQNWQGGLSARKK